MLGVGPGRKRQTAAKILLQKSPGEAQIFRVKSGQPGFGTVRNYRIHEGQELGNFVNFVVIENTQVESAFRSIANHQYIELMFGSESREFVLP